MKKTSHFVLNCFQLLFCITRVCWLSGSPAFTDSPGFPYHLYGQPRNNCERIFDIAIHLYEVPILTYALFVWCFWIPYGKAFSKKKKNQNLTPAIVSTSIHRLPGLSEITVRSCEYLALLNLTGGSITAQSYNSLDYWAVSSLQTHVSHTLYTTASKWYSVLVSI